MRGLYETALGSRAEEEARLSSASIISASSGERQGGLNAGNDKGEKRRSPIRPARIHLGSVSSNTSEHSHDGSAPQDASSAPRRRRRYDVNVQSRRMSRVSAIEPLKSCQYPKETTAGSRCAKATRARLSLASARARARARSRECAPLSLPRALRARAPRIGDMRG